MRTGLSTPMGASTVGCLLAMNAASLVAPGDLICLLLPASAAMVFAAAWLAVGLLQSTEPRRDSFWGGEDWVTGPRRQADALPGPWTHDRVP